MEFPGSGGSVHCANLAPGTLFAIQDNDAERTLVGGQISLSGIAGPANLAQCTYLSTTGLPASNLPITVLDAADPEGSAIEPSPTLVVLFAPDTTTTSMVTTTTLPPGAEQYSVVLTIDEAPALIGSIGLEIDYSQAPGQFEGTGAASSACVSQIDGGLFAMNDADRERVVRLGFVMPLSGVTAPHALATCSFTESDLENPPVAEDFSVTVPDASDIALNPIEETIGLAVVPPAP